MSDISYERRKAVAKAWKNEKSLVLSGKGTRDWNSKEQGEIIAKGKAKGYQGHHMKSVDGHNSKAGDPNNIQFLTRSEHLAAHGGDYHNNTNGYYDPSTGIMHGFGRNKAHIDSKNLSNPLSEAQKKAVLTKATKPKDSKSIKDAKEKARSFETRSVNKTKSSSVTLPRSKTTPKSKTLSQQRSTGISPVSKTATKSKTLAAQRGSNSSNRSKSVGVSSGKTRSVGKSGSKGKSAGHGH